MLKVIWACSVCPNTWKVSVSFKRRVWHYLVDVSRSPKMSHHILFNSKWRVAASGGLIIISGYLIFSLLFSLLIGNVHHFSLWYLLFNLSSYSINFLFRSFSIYRSIYYFQFSPSIIISHIFGFSFRSSFFKNF